MAIDSTELIRLSDYFQPLNFTTLSYFAFLLFFFDVLGTTVKKSLIKSSKKDSSRLINWLIGFAIFIFIWFILRFFIPPQRNNVILSLIFLSLMSFPSYFQRKQYKNLLSSIWGLKGALLIIVPFLPAIFVKASLPPYYSDEMAYQFISPSQLLETGTWHFIGNFYQNIPRLFNYFFTLSFSLTKTYSVARLFHFTILATTILFAFQRIKLLISPLAAYSFMILFFSLPISIVQTSTIGFVDVATYSFLFTGIIFALEYIYSQDQTSIILSSIFWTMALGSKYSSLIVLSSFIFSYFLISSIFQKSLLKKILKKGIILKLAVISLVFGGYWYLKNLIVFGNPIYPFLLPCSRYAQLCQKAAGSDFFSSWTTPVTFGNITSIFQSLLPANHFLQTAFIISIFLVSLNTNKKTKTISLILITTILTEFIILKYYSGFYLRYQQHIRLEMILLVIIQLGNQYKKHVIKTFYSIFYLILIIASLKLYKSTIMDGYQRLLTQQQKDYAFGKINIYDWIDNTFPTVVKGIYWCENPPSGKRIELVRLDPDMIWYGETGFMRSFTTNCFIKEEQSLDGIPLDQFINQAKVDKLKFWTVSINPCIRDSQVKIERHEEKEDEHKLYLRRLNNIIVCNSIEVEPNLYYFDYEKL